MTPKPAPPVSEWDALTPPVPMPSTLTGNVPAKDVVATIPEAIRIRAEANLAINATRKGAKEASEAARPRVDYHWDVQAVATVDQGVRFGSLMVEYAKYRPGKDGIPHAAEHSPKGQVTARPQAPAYYRNQEDGTPIATTEDADGAYLGVRYSVRPFEQRKGTRTLPGAASS